MPSIVLKPASPLSASSGHTAVVRLDQRENSVSGAIYREKHNHIPIPASHRGPPLDHPFPW